MPSLGLYMRKRRLFAVCLSARGGMRVENEPPAIHLSKHLYGPTSITYNLKRLKKTLPTDTIKGALLLLRVRFLLSSENSEKESVFLSWAAQAGMQPHTTQSDPSMPPLLFFCLSLPVMRR